MLRIDNEKGTFQISDEFSLEHHTDIIDNIKTLSRTDWLQFHADNRSLTLGNKTYAYKSKVQFDITL